MPRFTTSDGLSLAYEDEGTGTPLLCLPGLTRNARDFDDLAPVRPEGTRLIRLTFRGREPSDHDPVPANYQVPVEARDTAELLDHLGLDRVVIVGTSRGGFVAMALAAAARDRVAGVLLNDIGPEIEPEGMERIYAYVGREPTAPDLDALAEVLEANMGAGFPTLARGDWRRLAERWYRAKPEGGVGLRYDPRLAEPLLAARGAEADLWPLFDALKGIPLACVRGANSDLLSAATLARMAERHGDMIAAEVPDRGHVPFLNEPEALDALARLLARVAS